MKRITLLAMLFAMLHAGAYAQEPVDADGPTTRTRLTLETIKENGLAFWLAYPEAVMSAQGPVEAKNEALLRAWGVAVGQGRVDLMPYWKACTVPERALLTATARYVVESKQAAYIRKRDDLEIIRQIIIGD